jgi:hypothetical protein
VSDAPLGVRRRVRLPITCPSPAHHHHLRERPGSTRTRRQQATRGSIRQRGSPSWELRVYIGTDADTGRRRWATRTIRGERRDAERELVNLAAQANVA